MAGGKDQKDANAMLRSSQETAQKREDTSYNRNEADIAESKQHATDLYSTLRGQYGTLAAGQNQLNVPQGQAAGGGGGGGGGGAAGPAASQLPGYHGERNALMDESLGGFRDFAKTGGWDDARVKSMNENIQGFKDFGKTGGIDAAAEARMRGGGVYDEFAKTGGLSDQDRANMRSRATSVIPSMYQSMQNEANRGAAIQGGYGPGRAALMSRMGRQQAAGMADASLNAELGITNAVNQGRLAGAGGMASSENALQSLRTGNQLQGLQGASQVESNLQNSINQGKQFGIGGIGSQGENDRAAAMNAREADLRERSIAQQGGAMAASQANWEKQFAWMQQQAGMEGLQSLYSGQGSGEYNQNKQFGEGVTGQAGSMGGDLASRLKTGNKTWADYAAPIVGAVAGGMTGGLSTLGGMAIKGAMGAGQGPGVGQFGRPGPLM